MYRVLRTLNYKHFISVLVYTVLCTVCSVQYRVYSFLCTVYSVPVYQCTLHYVQCTVFQCTSVHCTMYSVQCTSVHCTMYRVQCSSVPVYIALCTVYGLQRSSVECTAVFFKLISAPLIGTINFRNSEICQIMNRLEHIHYNLHHLL